MATPFHCFGGLFLSFSLYFIHSALASHVYIVYLGLNQIHDSLLTTKHHIQLLSNVFASKEEANRSMLYSYKHNFSGFSAKINSTQAATLAKMEGVISVFKSKTLNLHTTRSWDFMGLTLDNHDKVTPFQLSHGDDLIVGIFDTGIWPESDSFQEWPGMGPVPKSWKGKCVSGEQFDAATACNKKLIAARYYLKGFEEQYAGPILMNMNGESEYRSPRDFLGHGTHTASTAVGSIVENASFFGLAQGTARGGAPRARLAVYKVCWNSDSGGSCSEADILAAFDDALNDGVDVISASFGVDPPLSPFFIQTADIGSFHAMQKGVSVVFSAGNAGPDPSLVTNVAPWSLCVAASSVDRAFPTQILLDNNNSVVGESFIVKQTRAKLEGARSYFVDGICRSENLRKMSRSAVGKVILCFSTLGSVTSVEAVAAAWNANASALIFAEPLTRQIVDVGIIPVIHIDIEQGTKLAHYLAQLPKLPTVRILPTSTVIKKLPAPTVAYFSSRGPSSLSPDILKPDLSGPGVNILAAWPSKTPPTLLPFDKRSVNWNFQSGTSMSCPHVSGAVALIKSAHPDWSPAAIKSALMTTAYTRDTTQDSILAGGSMKLADPFDIGAGHVDPLRAMDPGLVYDMKTSDYIIFLCNIGYTQDQIKNMVMMISPSTDTSCPKGPHRTNTNINYPSITVSNLQSTMTITRTVRNVGKKKTAIYFLSVASPNGLEVMIWPRVLIFSCFREEISYYVTLKPHKQSQGRYDFGEIVWSDGFHYVRSPLIVLANNTMDSGDSKARSTI